MLNSNHLSFSLQLLKVSVCSTCKLKCIIINQAMHVYMLCMNKSFYSNSRNSTLINLKDSLKI